MKHKTYTLTASEKKVERWFEWPMILVTLLLIITMLLPVLFTLPTAWVQSLAVINLIIWFTFYVELFVKFSVSSHWKETLKRNWVLLVIALSPLLLSFRLLYLSRLMGLTRLLGLQKIIGKLNRHVRAFVYKVEYIFISLIIFIIISAFVMWRVELSSGGAVNNLPDALWWSVITITTIGYGDIIPTSVEGKIAGAIIAIMGAVMFMIFVAKVTSIFIKRA